MDALETVVALPMDAAEAAVRSSLGEQGFGVLTEIDVAATLKARLGIDRPPLRILGACNPAFANRALELDASAALLLPCNVVLEEAGSGTRIRAVDPMGLLPGSELAELAAQVKVKLQAALEAVG